MIATAGIGFCTVQSSDFRSAVVSECPIPCHGLAMTLCKGIGKAAAICSVWIVVSLAVGCNSEAKPGKSSSSGGHVVLKLSNTAAIVEGKNGSRTFKLANPNLSPDQARAIVDHIYAEGGKDGGVWIWGRYDAPKVYDGLSSELSEIPTRLCMRDGSNCKG